MKTRNDIQEVIGWRHFLHQHPELAFQEEETSEFVATKLKSFGVDQIHRGLGKTGVVATVHGRGFSSSNPGKMIGLRADMDALPLEEKNNFQHGSKKQGKMHACGHDGHMAMLLGAARDLAKERDFPGTIVFIFQPAEEGYAGAKKMIEDGLFQRFPVEAVFGLHNWPSLPQGQVGVTSGPIMAASDFLTLKIKGKGGHAALPHLAIDPVVAASHIVLALQNIVSRQVDPLHACVISVTQIHGGTAFNIIPDEVSLKGSCRALTHEMREFLSKRIKEVAQSVGAGLGVQVEVEYRYGYPPTINSVKESALVADVAKKMIGKDHVIENLAPSMGAEDFSYMLQEKPGCYFWLGAGNPERGDCRIHNPHYDFNDEIVELGVDLWKGIARASLCFTKD